MTHYTLDTDKNRDGEIKESEWNIRISDCERLKGRNLVKTEDKNKSKNQQMIKREIDKLVIY